MGVSMSERLRRKRRETGEEKASGIPRGSSGGSGGGGGGGIPRGSGGGRSRSGGSGIPKGSSSSGGGGGGGGIPRGSSGSGGGRGGSGMPRGSSIRRGRSGGAGIPRGSKTLDDSGQLENAESKTAVDVEYKGVAGPSGTTVVDEIKGIVETYPSLTGVRDRVKDIIEPGAYEKTLKAIKPIGAWNHEWATPISKTLEAKELMPGDPELPETLSDGSEWPKGAGALKVVTQFNMDSDRSREAFSMVKFFGTDQEWSIGYKVPPGGATKDKDGTRRIKELELFEYSPVLHGAMPHAKTRTVKSLHDAVTTLADGGFDTTELQAKYLEKGTESKSATVNTDFDGLAASEVKDLVAAADLIDAYLDELGVKRATHVEGDPDLELPAEDERWVDSSADEGPMSLFGELEQVLDPDDFAELLELAAEFDDAYDDGDDAAAADALQDLITVFEEEEAADSELERLRDVIADVVDDCYPNLEAEGDEEDDEFDDDEDDDEYDDEYDDESDEGESEYEDDAESDDAEPEADDAGEKSAYWVKEIPKSKRDEMAKQGSALKDGTFPIADQSHLRSAIRLRTQGNAPNKVVDEHIKKRARALNLTHMLPDSMTAGHSKGKKDAGLLSESKALPSLGWADSADLVLSSIDFGN